MKTSIYIKADETMPWQNDEKFFYVLAREGVFRCRNHPFFNSCVKIKEGPKELASQKEFLRLSYPRIPRNLVERAVGFFQLVADKQNSEAAAIFTYDTSLKKVEMVIPAQTGINSAPSSQNKHGFPMDVKYEIPALEPGTVLIGDIHSHVDGTAYASWTDENDEVHRPGVHIIVGRIWDEPPQFYCDAVVDGVRFAVDDLDTVIEGYKKRITSDIPEWWVEKVKLKKNDPFFYSGYSPTFSQDPDQSDKDKIQKILSEISRSGKRPELEQVRKALFTGTKMATYSYCEEKAKKFVEAWEKNHEEQTAKR